MSSLLKPLAFNASRLPTKVSSQSAIGVLPRRPTGLQACYATAAVAAEDEATPEPLALGHMSSLAPAPSDAPFFDHTLKAAVLLSRPPLITRQPTDFENSLFFYQRRLNERLVLPFNRYFYYQRGTPGDLEWKRKIRERLTPSRDIGKFTAYSNDTWNDEILTGDKLSESQAQIETLVLDAQDKERIDDSQTNVKKEDSIERPLPRLTDADKTNDMRSLNRALSETLYLVVKTSTSKHGRPGWKLPESLLNAKEDLHMAAERVISRTGGENMNTWIVGNMPAAHQTMKFTKPTVGSATVGEKIFYMKARILAGHVNLDNNPFAWDDFQWMTAAEMRKALRPHDFAAVKDILSER